MSVNITIYQVFAKWFLENYFDEIVKVVLLQFFICFNFL